MKNQLFDPNEKNLGGRKQINELVYNHHLSLLKIKPTLKNFATKNANPKPKPKKTNNLDEELQFNEVYHSFKKIVEMKKGYIDYEKPITMDFKKNLAKKSIKQEKFIQSEHENNMISQKSRIERITLLVERKKNEFDPVVNPNYEIKTQPKKKKEGSLDFMFNPTLNQRKIIRPAKIQLKSK